MKQALLRITENTPLARDVYRMRLSGETPDFSEITENLRPGQFVNLLLEGLFLRRPISLCDWDASSLTLIYKAVGRGTDQMSRMHPGQAFDALIGLGNGYDLSRAGDSPLLLGGGVGIPPLYGLAKALRKEGKPVRVLLGFNTAEEVFALENFKALGCETMLATVDGSRGQKGFVTDLLPPACSYFYACGPLPMLRAVYRSLSSEGEFSLEERMGCGFGACMGCSLETRFGPKRVCREGPVFRKEELPWDV